MPLRRLVLVTAATLLVLDAGLAAAVPGPRTAARPPMLASTGFSLGSNGGLGGEAHLSFDRFAGGLPIAARFELAYRQTDAGDPILARRVFVNQATDGTPASSANRWDFRLDAVHTFRAIPNLSVYGGPRFSMYAAHFDYIGGNEVFDVDSRQFGLGMGLESRYPMTPRSDLIVGAGVDRYLDAAISGHDSTYNPDGTTVNAKENFTYAIANRAIHQPEWAPRLTLGVGYKL